MKYVTLESKMKRGARKNALTSNKAASKQNDDQHLPTIVKSKSSPQNIKQPKTGTNATAHFRKSQEVVPGFSQKFPSTPLLTQLLSAGEPAQSEIVNIVNAYTQVCTAKKPCSKHFMHVPC